MNHELFQAIVTIMGMNADQLAVVTAAVDSGSLVGNALNPSRLVDANSNPSHDLTFQFTPRHGAARGGTAANRRRIPEMSIAEPAVKDAAPGKEVGPSVIDTFRNFFNPTANRNSPSITMDRTSLRRPPGPRVRRSFSHIAQAEVALNILQAASKIVDEKMAAKPKMARGDEVFTSGAAQAFVTAGRTT